MSSIKPDNDSSKINCGQKVPCPFIVACGNPSILLELGKEILNQMSCFVQVSIILTLNSTVALRRDNRCFTLLFKSLKHALISIVSLVGQECIGSKLIEEDIGSIQVTGRVQESDESREDYKRASTNA